jgi:hypothetical protein
MQQLHQFLVVILRHLTKMSVHGNLTRQCALMYLMEKIPFLLTCVITVSISRDIIHHQLSPTARYIYNIISWIYIYRKWTRLLHSVVGLENTQEIWCWSPSLLASSRLYSEVPHQGFGPSSAENTNELRHCWHLPDITVKYLTRVLAPPVQRTPRNSIIVYLSQTI